MKTTPWLETFKALLQRNGFDYETAHTVFGEPDEGDCDETSHEWFKGNHTLVAFERKITIYEPHGHFNGEMLKVWGPNIHTQMESVNLNDEAGIIAAWKWFLGI